MQRSFRMRFSLNNAIIGISILFLTITDILFCLFTYNNYANCYIGMFINNYILIFIIIIWCIVNNIFKNFVLLCFMSLFFIFLMGQKLILFLNTGEYNIYLTFVKSILNDTEYMIFHILIFYSILCLFLGYFCAKILSKHHQKINIKTKTRQFIRCHIKWIWIFTMLCALITQSYILAEKSNVSYTQGYTMNVDIPYILLIGNYLFLGVTFLYLASLPSKNTTLSIFLLFIIINGIMQTFIGRRALLAQSILFFLWYFININREKINLKRSQLKYIILFIFLGIILFLAFGHIEQVRSHRSTNDAGILSSITSVVISTGGSDSVIANTIINIQKFPYSGQSYLFYPLYNLILDNPINKVLKAVFGYANNPAQGIEYLTKNNDFSHWISYIVCPELYLNGYGMGSCYIAEVYLAWGVIGVIIISFFLGTLICRLDTLKIQSENPFSCSTYMCIIFYIFVLPRSSLLSVVQPLFYVLLINCLFYILANIYITQKSKKTILHYFDNFNTKDNKK